MRTLLLIITLSIPFISTSQERKGAVVGISKNGFVNPFWLLNWPIEAFSDVASKEVIIYKQYGVKIGYQFNAKVRASLDVAFLNYKTVREDKEYESTSKEVTDYQFGLSVDHRLIESAKVSPKLRYKLGVTYYSAELNELGLYAATEILASMRFDEFTIDLGLDLNYLYGFSSGHGIGMGYTFSMSYLLPFNSKK